MAARIITKPGRTFQEFSLLPGLTTKDCTIANVSLETRLADSLLLGIPLLSAAMMSVTEYEMALALAKEKGIGILPARLPIDEQAAIVGRVKSYEMGFVQEPLTARETETIDTALKMVDKHGHSKVPIIDRNNTFLGIFNYQDYLKSPIARSAPVTKAMKTPETGVLCVNKPDITVDEAKKLLEEKNANYLVVVDNQQRLVKLAFKKDEEKLKVGAAISTHDDWKNRAGALIEAGADLIFVDTSDAHSEFAAEVVRQYKEMSKKAEKPYPPIGAGNIVTRAGAMYLMQAGADIIKTGMSSGSICTTQREKAVGRAPMTALIEADKARKEYQKKEKRYVRIIADGGITGPADMIIALTIADAVMMGGYFNKFYEAAGEKLDKDGKITTTEPEIAAVATWGEGSLRAQNLNRYGHSSTYTFFPEGIEGTVPYRGRLKPGLKQDLVKIRAAMSNAGSKTLDEFRRDAEIELNSPTAAYIIGNPHDVKVKG